MTHDTASLATRAAPADYERRLREAADDDERIDLTVAWVLDVFDRYYGEYLAVPALAQRAFEQRDHATSIALSIRRLSLYSESIDRLGRRLQRVYPQVAADERLWRRLEARYLPAIAGRYEADLTFAYIHSVRRKIHRGEWLPVEYDFGAYAERASGARRCIHTSFAGGACLTSGTVRAILAIPGFTTPFRDLDDDAVLLARRVNETLGLTGGDAHAIERIDMVNAGFYRNRGAYLVGRLLMRGGGVVPLIIALLNEEHGIYVDAVMTLEADAHNIFSSTLANFHVTTPYYHELVEFLHSVMPQRPLGLHYSTVGFNHLGKVAVMNELKAEIAVTGDVFCTSLGYRGTVAIGFSTASSAYNLKVIRNHPTEQYKWGRFEGVDSVLRKYARVHDINRTGSMLDNIIYYNLKLDRGWFDRALLAELLNEASHTVSLQGDAVILKNLIVQRRMTPLPVFLETASHVDAETAMVNLGDCIKNNAAANIFNKDLDARNYGVSKFLKVYLYDYDALEPFTEVKIRSNEGREEGEEDIPDWYFEDGVVFLPEEIEAGLMLPDRRLSRRFRELHGDLLTTAYWERLQHDLAAGEVPRIRTYPEERELRPARR